MISRYLHTGILRTSPPRPDTFILASRDCCFDVVDAGTYVTLQDFAYTASRVGAYQRVVETRLQGNGDGACAVRAQPLQHAEA